MDDGKNIYSKSGRHCHAMFVQFFWGKVLLNLLKLQTIKGCQDLSVKEVVMGRLCQIVQNEKENMREKV